MVSPNLVIGKEEKQRLGSLEYWDKAGRGTLDSLQALTYIPASYYLERK